MGFSSSQSVRFSLLPEIRKPWTEFAFSIAAESIVIALFLWLGVLHPEVLRPSEHTYRSIELAPTPVPVNHAPQPLRSQRPVLVARLDSSAALHMPAAEPKLRNEVVPEIAPEVKITDKKLEPLPPTAPVIPKQAVKTNVFSTGSSAPQTVAKAPDQVQTGGFGDPHGVPAKASDGKAVNIAQLGSFDLPSGPGNGNGTGGSRGTRGVVASTGFGNGVSTGDGHVQASHTSVQQAGFGDADVPAPPTVHARAAEASARVIPAEILSKPVPVYTPEARGLRIEGEVLLEVVLEASGRLHVLRVVRGLGHGLDDSAVHAAEQIRFKPASRDGQPADSTAVLHIVFQLA
ncbi:MAG: energy transducer TonB [Candidatus Sulfotelmatobacter sp.]